MAATRSIDAHTVGNRLGKLLHTSPDVVEVRVHEEGGTTFLWVITVPTDLEGERRIVRSWMPIYDEYPEIVIDVRLLNPARFPTNADLRELLSSSTQLIPRA
jgi:hypothetical protein